MGKKEDNIKKLETIFREKINPDISSFVDEYDDETVLAKTQNYMVRAVYYAIDDIDLTLLEEEPIDSGEYYRKYTTNIELSDLENIPDIINYLKNKGNKI